MSDITDKEYEQALAEEIALEEAKIEEIEKKFESQSIFDRIKLLLRGLKAPAGSREYKEALIEMQRLLAPGDLLLHRAHEHVVAPVLCRLLQDWQAALF